MTAPVVRTSGASKPRVALLASRVPVPAILASAALITLGAAMTLLPAPAAALPPPDDQVFAFVDAAGSARGGGIVSFCPPDTACVEFEVEARDGRLLLPIDALEIGVAYRVVYRLERAGREHALARWTYQPTAWAPDIDPYLGIPSELVRPTFVVPPTGNLSFKINRAPNPAWESAHTEFVAGAGNVRTPSRWRVTVGTPLVLGGNFSTDPEALFGVEKVYPGLGLAVSWRPRVSVADHVTAEQWFRYLELSLGWAANRYTTRLALDPEATGDVTFHRALLSLGLGTMRGGVGLDLGGGLVLAYGAVLDGNTVLETADRRYTMFGVGGYLRAAWTFALGGVALGPAARFDYVYYPADTAEDDFWYGGMPTLSLGLAVHGSGGR